MAQNESVYRVGQTVKISKGPYKNRPGVIRATQGDKCTVTLTDAKDINGVTMYNMTWNDMIPR